MRARAMYAHAQLRLRLRLACLPSFLGRRRARSICSSAAAASLLRRPSVVSRVRLALQLIDTLPRNRHRRSRRSQLRGGTAVAAAAAAAPTTGDAGARRVLNRDLQSRRRGPLGGFRSFGTEQAVEEERKVQADVPQLFEPWRRLASSKT